MADEWAEGLEGFFAHIPRQRWMNSFEMQYTSDRTAEDRKADYYGTRADVWGDGRQEVILFGSRGACIYANARPLQIPTLYNNTLYQGM